MKKLTLACRRSSTNFFVSAPKDFSCLVDVFFFTSGFCCFNFGTLLTMDARLRFKDVSILDKKKIYTVEPQSRASRPSKKKQQEKVHVLFLLSIYVPVS